MDVMKVFGKNEKEINSLIRAVDVFSCDIGMEIGINKYRVKVINKGRVGYKYLEILEIAEGYKYFEVLELDKIKEQEMIENVRKKYMCQLKLITKLKLYGRNKIKDNPKDYTHMDSKIVEKSSVSLGK